MRWNKLSWKKTQCSVIFEITCEMKCEETSKAEIKWDTMKLDETIQVKWKQMRWQAKLKRDKTKWDEKRQDQLSQSVTRQNKPRQASIGSAKRRGDKTAWKVTRLPALLSLPDFQQRIGGVGPGFAGIATARGLEWPEGPGLDFAGIVTEHGLEWPEGLAPDCDEGGLTDLGWLTSRYGGAASAAHLHLGSKSQTSWLK